MPMMTLSACLAVQESEVLLQPGAQVEQHSVPQTTPA